MQIPPTTALLNLLATLPAQSGSIAASTPAAKPTPSVSATVPPAPTASASFPDTSATDERPAQAVMRRGSMVNILA